MGKVHNAWSSNWDAGMTELAQSRVGCGGIAWVNVLINRLGSVHMFDYIIVWTKFLVTAYSPQILRILDCMRVFAEAATKSSSVSKIIKKRWKDEKVRIWALIIRIEWSQRGSYSARRPREMTTAENMDMEMEYRLTYSGYWIRK